MKEGAEAPSSYSHSSGIWMSRQGLHRRRGHKYRSATAIFPAAPAARLGSAQPAVFGSGSGPEGRGLVGGLGWGHWDRGGGKGGGGERRERTVVSD